MGIFLVRRSVGETTGFGCRLPLELDFGIFRGPSARGTCRWSPYLGNSWPYKRMLVAEITISSSSFVLDVHFYWSHVGFYQFNHPDFFPQPNSCEWLIGLNYSHVFNQLFLDFTTIVLQQSPIFSLFFWAQLGHKNCGCWVAPAVPGPCEGVWMRLRSCTLALANMGGIQPPILWRDVCKCIDKNMWLW